MLVLNHKPTILGWFAPPIYGVFLGVVYYCYTHISIHQHLQNALLEAGLKIGSQKCTPCLHQPRNQMPPASQRVWKDLVSRRFRQNQKTIVTLCHLVYRPFAAIVSFVPRGTPDRRLWCHYRRHNEESWGFVSNPRKVCFHLLELHFMFFSNIPVVGVFGVFCWVLRFESAIKG